MAAESPPLCNIFPPLQESQAPDHGSPFFRWAERPPDTRGGATNIIPRERLVAGTALGPLDKRHLALASNRAARGARARAKKHPRRVISRQSFCMLFSVLQGGFLARCGLSPRPTYLIDRHCHRLARGARSLSQVPRLCGGKFQTRRDALETFFSIALLGPRQRCCQNSPARF